MYSIDAYGSMIADRVRMSAYAQALREAVNPGSVVLDIGTGTGIFALLACKYGARKVYAIEPDNAIHVAREIAAVNGYSERIEFLQQFSTQVTLPEKADVIISDVGGLLPWFKNHISSIIDARLRLLAPKGVLIPLRDTLWVSVVEAPDLYSRITNIWEDNDYALDMTAARQYVINSLRRGRLTSEHLLLDPQCWAVLDYTSVLSDEVQAELTWTVSRPGTAHGFGLWFNRTLANDIHLSNAPDRPEHQLPVIYSTLLFPWTRPVSLTTGDLVSATLQAKLISDDYIWRWDTRVLEQGDPQKIKADFKQSTFYGVPLSPAQLRKTAASYVPTLSEDGQIDRFILDLMDNHRSLEDIARSVSVRWHSRFPTWGDALTRAGELSTRHSK